MQAQPICLRLLGAFLIDWRSRRLAGPPASASTRTARCDHHHNAMSGDAERRPERSM